MALSLNRHLSQALSILVTSLPVPQKTDNYLNGCLLAAKEGLCWVSYFCTIQYVYQPYFIYGFINIKFTPGRYTGSIEWN